MLGKKPLKIFGSGTDERDYVYVDDVVEAVVKVTESSLAGPFNIATGIGTNPNLIFEMIAELCDYEEEAVHVAPRDGDIEKIYLDVSKAKSELNWSPQISFEDGLKTTVDWFRQQSD
jgi:nucleoside-diphosphate-sugar epimerase